MGLILANGLTGLFDKSNMHSHTITEYTQSDVKVNETIDVVMFLAQPLKPQSRIYRDGSEAAKIILENLYDTQRPELNAYLSTNFELDATILSKDLVLNVFGL
jgi:hypothetical protein